MSDIAKSSLPKAMRKIFTAIELDSHECIGRFLKAHPTSVNSHNWNGETALMFACSLGHAKCVTALLNHGASVNLRSVGNQTALHAAVKRGCAVCVKLLLDKRANVNAIGRHGFTPLHVAAKLGNAQIAKIILKKKKTNIYALADDEETPFCLAAQFGKVGMLKLLLTEEKRRSGKYQCQPVLLTLPMLTKLSDMDLKVHHSPLMVAAAFNRPKCTQFLIDRGADMWDSNFTAFHVAVIRKSIGSLFVLLNHIQTVGLEILQSQEAFLGILHFACEIGNVNVVEQLTRAGLDLNSWIETSHYPSLLVTSLHFGHRLTFTPLGIASYNGHMEVVVHLLSSGAKINCGFPETNQTYVQALEAACYGLHADIMLLLLENGAALRFSENWVVSYPMQELFMFRHWLTVWHEPETFALLLQAGLNGPRFFEELCRIPIQIQLSQLDEILKYLQMVTTLLNTAISYLPMVQDRMCLAAVRVFMATFPYTAVLFIHKLRVLLMKPSLLTLKELCRFKVRENLGQRRENNFFAAVPQLGLPLQLQDYLLFK